ncbi:MAG: serine/threonine protein kinase [Deltaproteobacteria bacterium]|nr:serine/threonine protein kinase [Deltaproteobacteria bacterium]
MKERLLEVWGRLVAAWPAARNVAGDGELRVRWLKSARAAQLTLLGVLVAGFLVVPPLTAAVADTVFTPRTSRSWFRSRVRRKPASEVLGGLLTGMYWLGGFGTTAALLVLHAPKVVPRREEASRDAGFDQTMVAPGAAPPAPETNAPAEAFDALGATMAPEEHGGAATEGRSDAPKPPARYTIIGELGRGGMGVVYEATDTVLERQVALKELRRGRLDASSAERFRREARVLAKLRHPGIVQIYDLAEEPGSMWIAIELVRGGGLDHLLEKEGKLPLGRACALGASLADTLAYAHGERVVHRDFKPANVLLTSAGEPKVTDFGLAKLLSEGPKLTQIGSVMGSPGYMSPEQATGGETDHRADVYAFGVTLFEMVTGRCPFEGDTRSVLAAHITKSPPTPAELGVEVPGQLGALIASLLAKEPGERPGDMAEVAVTLRELATET